MCVHGRNVRVIARGTAGGREPVGLFFAIDLVVHLLLKWVVCLKKKREHTYRGHQKRKKKEVPSTGIELATFDWIV